MSQRLHIHTSVHNRLDVAEVWVRAMRNFCPDATLHVWYSEAKPTFGDYVHQMPHVGIAAPAYVVRAIPNDTMKVFIECDIMPVLPWSPNDYPGGLVMLEGCPGKRWPGVTIARPECPKTAAPVLMPQRYAKNGGCPSWVPESLRDAILTANAKVVGNHFVHLDKMHRPQGASPEKAALLAAMSAHYPNAIRGLGDAIEAGLSAIGITKDRVQAVASAMNIEDCGCGGRQAALNATFPFRWGGK